MKDYSNYYSSLSVYMKGFADYLFDLSVQNCEGFIGKIDGVDEEFLVYNHLNPLNELKEERKIVCRLDSNIHRGSIVEFDNEVYLVISDVDNDRYHKFTKISKCNNELKWRDRSGKTHSVPVILNNLTLYSDGIESKKNILSQDGKRSSILSNNDLTKQLKIGQNFIINHNSKFSISHIDDFTENGIITLTLVQETIDYSKDNLELNIANYYDIKNNYSFRIIDGDLLKLKPNDSFQIKIEVFNCNDSVNIADVSIKYFSKNEDFLTIDGNGLIKTFGFLGETEIIVNVEGIEKLIKVLIVDTNVQNGLCRIEGNITIAQSMEEIYRAYFYDESGLPIDDETIVWSITNTDNSENQYVTFIEEDNEHCVIKAVNNWRFVGKEVILKCENFNGTISNEIKITIKSLLD